MAKYYKPILSNRSIEFMKDIEKKLKNNQTLHPYHVKRYNELLAQKNKKELVKPVKTVKRRRSGPSAAEQKRNPFAKYFWL